MHDSTWIWLSFAIVGTAASDIWRFAGVFLSRGVDPDSAVIAWVKDVSTALVAALIARMLLSPTGALAGVGDAVRFIAFGAGLAAFGLSGRRLAVGLLAAEAAFFAAHALLET
ncbi:AzlD domain-containing protein [Rhodomicrobium lacus]|uniref:AzlD domain-containing protein n=1 Tax=Rhodomicrobium TaxID=1068 RepID=UPI0026E3D72D|nr:AzlD domain-containing protein [Rhodomicrobium lacus]WKW51096.1 AzlD domain-containing protein [Rhodomicrobium lacus]